MADKYTEAQKRASIKYMQEKTDDIRLRVPKGTKDRWKAAAERAGADSMTKFVMDAVDAAPRWISAEDALPEPGEWVVAWYADKDGDYFPTIGKYVGKTCSWTTDVDDNDHAYPPVKITHWMRLPKPPVTNESNQD